MGLLQPVRSMASPPEALHIIMLARAAVTTMAPRTRAKSRLFGKNGRGWRQCWRTPMGSRFYESTLVHPGTRNFITLPGDTIDTVLLASSIVSSQNAAVPLPLANMATPGSGLNVRIGRLPKNSRSPEPARRRPAAAQQRRVLTVLPILPRNQRHRPRTLGEISLPQCARNHHSARSRTDPGVEELRTRPRLTGASREQRYTRYTSRPDW